MRYELADYEWTAIRPMLPNKPRGVPRVNDRRVLNGVFWVLRSGAPWRDLPVAFGPYTRRTGSHRVVKKSFGRLQKARSPQQAKCSACLLLLAPTSQFVREPAWQRRSRGLSLSKRRYFFGYHTMRLGLTTRSAFSGYLHASERQHALRMNPIRTLPRVVSGVALP
jgi:transposase